MKCPACGSTKVEDKKHWTGQGSITWTRCIECGFKFNEKGGLQDMTDNEKTISITIKGIDPEDYRYFKIACARENVTTKQAIINLIREFGTTERND